MTAADGTGAGAGGPDGEVEQAGDRALTSALLFIALVVAVVGSLGAPLITAVAGQWHVPLASAQWTLTAPLLVGTIATPVLGRLGSGSRRRPAFLATLGIVLLGGLLTVLPTGFAGLVAGRAAQGAGLGLTALTMGVARDQVKRSGSLIALLSVASTVGIGVGYPLAGLLAQTAGVRTAYAAGLAVTALAAVVAWRTIPDAPAGRGSRVDTVGALLLAGGLLAALLVLSGTVDPLWLLAGAALIAAWAWHERRATAPLVDLTLLRHPAVAAANATMLLGGLSMYLLLTLVTRYVQTPRSAGYGFGATVLGASLVLIPFSALGFVGGRLAARLRSRFAAPYLLAASAGAVLVACAFFALSRSQLWEPYAVMGLLGLAVGVFSAAMPAAILAVTPAAETSSAMGFNQVVRSTGFSAGSAVGGLVLAAQTSAAGFPAESGYTLAAWLGAGAAALTVIGQFRPPRHTRKPVPRVHGDSIGDAAHSAPGR